MGSWHAVQRGYNGRSCARREQLPNFPNRGRAVNVTVPDFTESERELVADDLIRELGPVFGFAPGTSFASRNP